MERQMEREIAEMKTREDELKRRITLLKAEAEIQKAKAVDEVYAGSEYSKFERKPVCTKEVGEKPLARPLLPREDLNQIRRNCSRSGLNPSAEPWYPGPPRTSANGADLFGSQQLQQVLGQQHEALQLMAYSLQQALEMPKRELLTFDGNPLSYWLFINNFEVNIAKRVRDAESRLTYLIQLCTGKAREAIKNCAIISPPERGYEKAQEILYQRFGRKHVIARAHIAKIVDGPQLKATDVVGLSDLSVEMQNCALTLIQMGYEADINSSDNLVKIMRRLPVHLQSKWANTAGQLTLRGIEPTFSHLAKFVEERAGRGVPGVMVWSLCTLVWVGWGEITYGLKRQPEAPSIC